MAGRRRSCRASQPSSWRRQRVARTPNVSTRLNDIAGKRRGNSATPTRPASTIAPASGPFSLVGCWPAHISATTAHRSSERHADADATTEANFDGGHHAAGDRTFCPQRTHEHPAPLLRSIIDPTDTARGVRSPSRLAQRIHDESDEGVHAAGDGCIASRPRLPQGSHDSESDIGRRRYVQPKPDVRRRGSGADVIGTHFGLQSFRRLLASLGARLAARARERDNRNRHRSTPAARVGASPHVARSRQSASV